MYICRTLYKCWRLSVFCLNMLVFYDKTKDAVLTALQYGTKSSNRF